MRPVGGARGGIRAHEHRQAAPFGRGRVVQTRGRGRAEELRVLRGRPGKHRGAAKRTERVEHLAREDLTLGATHGPAILGDDETRHVR